MTPSEFSAPLTEQVLVGGLFLVLIAFFLSLLWEELRRPEGQKKAAPAEIEIRPEHLIDGDSARIEGVSYRLTGMSCSFNTPETREGSRGRDNATVTRAEARWGAVALQQGRILIKRGARLCPMGRKDKFGRELARIRLRDGSDYGDEMVRIGLAAATARREHEMWQKPISRKWRGLLD